MEPRYLGLAEIQPFSLSLKTPPGFYLDLSSEPNPVYFISHGNSDGPMAFRLDVLEPVVSFLPAAPEDRFQLGLSIGAIEVEVDVSQALSSHLHPMLYGDLYQGGEDGLTLKARLAGMELEEAHVKIGPAHRRATEGGLVIYPSWRLVRKCPDGSPWVVFVRTPPPSRPTREEWAAAINAKWEQKIASQSLGSADPIVTRVQSERL